MTGCPTASYELQDDYMRKIITNGHFWRLLNHYKSEKYLIVFETEPVVRWTTIEDELKDKKHEEEKLKKKNNLKDLYDLRASLEKGKGYVVEKLLMAGEHQLVKLRCPLSPLQWDGKWAEDDPKWKEPTIKRAMADANESEDHYSHHNVVWMNLLEVVSFFKQFSVCRINNWQEVRMPGRFLRVYDAEDKDYSAVLSKWYY